MRRKFVKQTVVRPKLLLNFFSTDQYKIEKETTFKGLTLHYLCPDVDVFCLESGLTWVAASPTEFSTPATFVSSDRIECHTPTWTKEESVTIDISLNGVVADRKETTAVVSLESNASVLD